jgi:transposase
MEHIAIDLGSRTSQICVRDAQGQIVEERAYTTRHLGAYLRRRPAGQVIVEASSEAFGVARMAQAAGHQISVVPSVLSRALGVGYRGIKTDVRDARALSEASTRVTLPSVHIPSEQSVHWRAMSTSRQALVRTRTLLINRVRGYLRTQLRTPVRGTSKTMPKAVRRAMESSEDGLPSHIEAVLLSLEALSAQIADIEHEMATVLDREPTAKLLMSMPGVGPITALRFMAAVDDVTRFGSAQALTSYLGLHAGERSSGQTRRRTGIIKAGPSAVRHALGQAAWSLWRNRPEDPMVLWARRIAERRNRQIALTALSRKMAGVLYAMWRDGRPYQPQPAAQPTA